MVGPAEHSDIVDHAVDRIPPDRWYPGHADAFADRLRGLIPADTPTSELPTALERINLTDLHLAVAASHADVRAVRDFESLILMPAAGRLERLEMEHESRREVVQRVRIKLLTPSAGSPKIALYQGRGELQTWVAVVLLREAYTMMRSAHREALAEGLDLLLLETTASGPELSTIKAEHRVALVRALTAAIAELTAEQRNVLRLHHLHGTSIDQLAVITGVHRATVARRLARMRSQLLERTDAFLGRELGVDSAERRQIMDLALSSFELSLDRILAGSLGGA